MASKLTRGTLEHCLEHGVWAERLLNRFRAVVSEEEMALVQYWFEELHQKADFYRRQGHELVGVGIENRGKWDAGPFMLFNPTRWNGSRRELVSPTSTFNPRKWVSIQARSSTRPFQASSISGRSSQSARIHATSLPASGHSSSAHIPRDLHHALQPILEGQVN